MKKVLLVSDSAAIHTGFGRVAREIGTGLCKAGFLVKQLGWFHSCSKGNVFTPFEIIPCAGEGDSYGERSFDVAVAKFRPDIVLAIGDPWMLKSVILSKTRTSFSLVVYVPVDGQPFSKNWAALLNMADTVVSYADFGTEQMIYAGVDNKKIVKINHGVDLDTFKPLDKETVKKETNSTGLFVVGTVARNQPRKNFPILMKAVQLFVAPYSVCTKCGMMYFQTPEKKFIRCECGGGVLDYPAKSNIKLYMHTMVIDSAWDLNILTERYHLEDVVIIPQGLSVGGGITDMALNHVMNSFDAFVLPTAGEGWGLPILESMAAGIPTMATDYSAHVEFCKDAALLIEVSEFYTETDSMTERALPSVLDIVFKLDSLYLPKNVFIMKWGNYIEATKGKLDYDKLKFGKELCLELSSNCRKRAEDYSWKRVVSEWVNLIDTFPARNHRTEQIVEL
jgi:glycosyltransferase involved in cell wall biosynthesis